MNRQTEDIVESLSAAIIRHRELYDLGKPKITDQRYDKLVATLKKLVRRNPHLDSPDLPIYSVGDVKGETAKHLSPMLSLRTEFDFDEALRIIESNFPGPIAVQPKLDGVSLTLVYKKVKPRVYKLQRALLRGDGKSGEVVTGNVLAYTHVKETIECNNFTDKLPLWLRNIREFELRGECLFTEQAFVRVRDELGYKSARNAIAGILRRKQLVELPSRAHFICFGFGSVEPKSVSVQLRDDFETDVLGKIAEAFGVKTVPSVTIMSNNLSKKLLEGVVERLAGSALENDGLVLKAESRMVQHKLGLGDTYPLWALALKLQRESAVTSVKGVEWSVGRTGVVTPVLQLKPVKIRGASISNVTLHNLGVFRELRLSKGDRVEIERRGGVIPKFSKVVGRKVQKVQTRTCFPAPTHCPSCHNKLREDGPRIYCPNIYCSSRIVGHTVHFAKVLGIEGLSLGTAKLLYDEKVIEHPSDILALTVKRLLVVPGFAQVSARLLVAEIQRRKVDVPLRKVFQALNIHQVGGVYSQGAELFFKKVQEYMNWPSTKQGIAEAAEGIARELGKNSTGVHKSLTASLLSKASKAAVGRMLDAGLTVKEVKDMASPLRHKNIVFTGSLSEPRNKFVDAIEAIHGFVRGSVTARTDFLVVGNSPTRRKVEAAGVFGTKIINEEELRRMLPHGSV